MRKENRSIFEGVARGLITRFSRSAPAKAIRAAEPSPSMRRRRDHSMAWRVLTARSARAGVWPHAAAAAAAIHRRAGRGHHAQGTGVDIPQEQIIYFNKNRSLKPQLKLKMKSRNNVKKSL